MQREGGGGKKSNLKKKRVVGTNLGSEEQRGEGGV